VVIALPAASDIAGGSEVMPSELRQGQFSHGGFKTLFNMKRLPEAARNSEVTFCTATWTLDLNGGGDMFGCQCF
jgi:hypothetical protein